MKRVFIKYNPYRVTTEITIDDQPLKKNSKLIHPDQRLQEWVDELTDVLYEECSTRDFEITFYGTTLDFEDVEAVVKEASAKGFTIILEHIQAKEIKDKEKAIDDIFTEIQNGPFEELKQPDVERAFKMAKSSDFEVNVVATMSAGKSTLINSLLGQRLMPAKQETCTATITKIKDVDDLDHFEANVYDKSGNLIKTCSKLSYEIMKKWNEDPEVSEICAEGNIPFVPSEDISLVLVDTPGPNNSRDPKHKEATYRMLSKSSKTVVLYVMNATQLAVNDDNNLLKYVAESMKVGGKQSRDRFIFVVNKLDEFGKDDSVESTLEEVRLYLADNGIENPNIYPASALTALYIRMILAQSDDIDMDDAEYLARKLLKREEMFLEKYAPLPASAKSIIDKRLAKAREEQDDKEQALIHSGVVSVEEAIRMYVLKYAKTAKIKNIVDTFLKKLESAQSFETTKKEISSNQEERDAIVEKIDSIQAKLLSGEEARKFEQVIDNINYDKEVKELTDNVRKKSQEEITRAIEKCKEASEESIDFPYPYGVRKAIKHNTKKEKEKLSKEEAEEVCKELEKNADDLQAKVKVELEDIIKDTVKKNADNLLEQYKKKLADLVDEIKVGSVELDPFEIMKGEIPDISSTISDSRKTERVNREEWISNDNKKWYKPWTWFQESGHYIEIVEEKEYISLRELTDSFFAPIDEQIYENCSSAEAYAAKEVKRIKEAFAKKFKELNKLLNTKLEELKACATDREKAQEKLEQAQSRLEWLNNIQGKVNDILDI